MILKKQEILDFQKLTQHIYDNPTMPILSYILWEGNTLTKTNIQAYAQHTIESVALEPILLEETFLYAILNEADHVVIENDGHKVKLTSGEQELEFGAQLVADFPRFPLLGETVVTTIGRNALEAIGIASQFTDKKLTNFRLLYSTNNDVFSTDNACMYFKQFDKLPELALSPEAGRIISVFESLDHYTNGQIDFFKTAGTIYGFIQSHNSKANYYSQIAKFPKEGGVKLNVQRVRNFCNLARELSGDKECICSITDTPDGVLLAYKNDSTNKAAKLPMKCDKRSPITDFRFDARQFATALNLPYEQLWFNPFAGRAILYTEQDPFYMGFIAGKI